MTIPVTVHAMKYYGFVDVTDLVTAILSEGHHVEHAINRSGRDTFYAIDIASNAAQVRRARCVFFVWRRHMG